MSIPENVKLIKSQIPDGVELVVVSKTKSVSAILEVYKTGELNFGENKVQELLSKYDQLPSDIRWHLIGHLQTNKVKYIAPFVHLIHSIDSLKLLTEVNKQAKNNNRVINCLLQIHIAKEETKFGLSEIEALELLKSEEFKMMKNVNIIGLMGMASFTTDKNIVDDEFRVLANFFNSLKSNVAFSSILNLNTLSMGMSGDFLNAIEQGSNMVRVGSAIFGERDSSKQ